jgi:hypothetical protein
MTLEPPEQPITIGERSAFEAATQGTPKQYEDWCKKCGIDAAQLLDRFDAEPARWIYYWIPTSEHSALVRMSPFPPPLREKLDAVRAYINRPRRGLFGRR